ncbi:MULTISPECIES: response regulator [Micrococcaceae]|uniref:Response regulator n=1 Tax=Glutamicibacter soli TaxID=453836 RepID=A0A365YHN7_9MICC|nr:MULTISPECIES: response regulator transcription factor [Micrococcaceae]ALQ29818.1 LuxR family transcriptional regulator [Arthrobacter sp. YC-RL1]KLI88834.1 LuxR family transcriptional regulator [Arthrobacter sp. YC-RL1]NAZ15103.1 response regulator [Glutamicibacter soli]RBM01543.1 DNA-binding response regulator [Glutamicibacter soli]
MSKISVVICDDQPLIVSSLKLILETDPQISVVGTAENGEQGVALVTELNPSVVLMDIQMPQLDGIAATSRISRDTDTKVVVLTTFNRDDYLFDALDAGASGFLLKNTDPETLITAVHQVAAGHGLLSPEVTLKLIRHRSAPAEAAPDADGQDLLSALTERELQVLTELAKGKNNQEIAAVLSLSEATVKTHLSNLLAKLHLRDRVQGVLFAHRVGLIQ